MKPSFRRTADGLARALRAPVGRLVLGLAVAGVVSSVAIASSLPDRHGVLRQAGDLDPGFGTDGRVIVSVDEAGGLAAPQSALLPDGKILSVGIISPDTVFLMRKDSEGWPDFGFGQGGAIRVTLDIDGQYGLRDRIVLPDGKLLLAGNVSRSDGTTNLLYVRFTPEGRLDPTFGTGGLAEIALPSGDDAQAQHMALLPDGKIVAAVRSVRAPGVWDSLLLRLTADGQLDPSFASGGISVHPLRGSLIRRVTVLPDGKMMLSGSYLEYALLSRYNADGHLDETFGSEGHFRLLAPGILEYNHINDVAVQDDGRLVVAGAAGGNNQTSVIARVEADGSGLDPDFNDGVPLLVPSATGTTEEEAIAVQTDGKIVSLGRNTMQSRASARILRLHADGRFDTGFGQEGIVATEPNMGVQHLLRHLQIQPDGKYLASGLVHDAGRDSLGAFRFLAL